MTAASEAKARLTKTERALRAAAADARSLLADARAEEWAAEAEVARLGEALAEAGSGRAESLEKERSCAKMALVLRRDALGNHPAQQQLAAAEDARRDAAREAGRAEARLQQCELAAADEEDRLGTSL